MKSRKLFCKILILFLLSSTFLCIILLKNDNQNDDHKDNYVSSENLNNDFELKSANGDALNQSSIFQNTSAIRRGFESIRFVVNVSGFEYANKTYMKIHFTNSSVIKFNMSYVVGTNNNFTFTYSPKGYAPLGLQRVNFEIHNFSNNPLNTNTTFTNFTIKSNSMINFNSSEYLRGEYLLADLNDISEKFDWSLSVVNDTIPPQQFLFNLGDNVLQINFEINESFDQFNRFYYVRVFLTETSTGKTASEYFKFFVRNTVPLIIQSTVKFNPTSVFRSKDCVVDLNVSDVEYSAPFINVTMILEDPNGNTLPAELLDNNNDGSFTKTFSVSTGRPAGNYRVRFEAEDPSNDTGEFSTFLTVKNNPPEIDGYEINDIDTDERISVLYGEDLVFEFDVYDDEGIAYITVKLIDQDDEEYEITREYEDDLEITIRTEDLITGTWTVYVSVTDTDGMTTKLDSDYDTGPQEITIIPDLLSDILPWIMLFIGLGIGLIGVIVVALARGKSKELTRKITKEKKVVAEKKPVKAKRPKKEKIELVKKEIVKKEVEPQKAEEEKPKKITTKRKIKRKL